MSKSDTFSSERRKQHCVCLLRRLFHAIRIINREANYAKLITRSGEAYYYYTEI